MSACRRKVNGGGVKGVVAHARQASAQRRKGAAMVTQLGWRREVGWRRVPSGLSMEHSIRLGALLYAKPGPVGPQGSGLPPGACIPAPRKPLPAPLPLPTPRAAVSAARGGGDRPRERRGGRTSWAHPQRVARASAIAPHRLARRGIENGESGQQVRRPSGRHDRGF